MAESLRGQQSFALAEALRECRAIIANKQSRTDPDRRAERLREISEEIYRLELHTFPNAAATPKRSKCLKPRAID